MNGDEGATPEKEQEVLVNYEGRLTDGTIFDSSYDREALKVIIGVGQVIKGWDIGIMSMKLGEKAELTIASDLAYGDMGSPPTIPAKATLIFTVELIQISDRRPTRWMMSDMELVAAAKKLKDDGGARFKAKEFKAAEGHYRDSIAHLDTVKNDNEDLKTLKVTVLQNTALCCKNTNDFKACVALCTKALGINAQAEKALLFRSQARSKLNDFDNAIEDIKNLIKLKPQEKTYRTVFEEIKEARKKNGDYAAAVMKKMFSEGMYNEKETAKV